MCTATLDKVQYEMDYSQVFGSYNATTLALINSCRYINSDAGGEYVYDAVSITETGIVTFQKRYIKL